MPDLVQKTIHGIEDHPKWTAAVCGFLLAGSYPPLPFIFLSALAWVPLFFLIQGRTYKQIFRLFFIYGWTACAGTLYWVANDQAPNIWHLILIGLFILFCYFALYFGVAGLWACFVYKKWKEKGLLMFPPFWVLNEYVRSLGELSFPWCTLGYTWGPALPLVQGLSVFGVYFYSLLILEIAVVLFLLIKFGWNDRCTKISALSVSGIILALFLSGVFVFKKQQPELPLARVAMVQPNIDQLKKWNRAFVDSAFIKHQELTLAACKDTAPDFIVWSETSLPMYFLKTPPFVSRTFKFSDSLGIPLLFGSLDFEYSSEKNKEFDYYNCAFWYDPAKKDIQKYAKMRLLPFSEALPFTGVFPLLNAVDLGEADFSTGKQRMIFSHKNINLSPSICYEIIYPSFIRKSVLGGCNLLVNITNDAWFGKTSGPYQHLNMSRFRCIENRIWLARCANSGISAIINPKGQFVKKTTVMSEAYLTGTAGLTNAPTFYSRHGDVIVFVCLLGVLCSFLLRYKKKNLNSKNP